MVLNDFISLLFPNACFICDEGLAKGEKYLCTGCIYRLPKTNSHLLRENPLIQRFHGILEVKAVISYLNFIKKGSVPKLFYKMKYENFAEIGEILGRWFGQDLKESGFKEEYDIVMPVPLHKSKLRKRGYNQSDGIAKGIAEILELPWDNKSLFRSIKNISQTSMGRIERWKNVENIFTVKNQENVEDKRILLVDDVLTTGATLEACGAALLNAGCSELGIATLAAAQ
ncbi:ComF family protein [soil metagenome]